MFHVKHFLLILFNIIFFSLLFRYYLLKLICAMKVIEIGQDWKIAALRSNFHVHFFFFGGFVMNKEFLCLAFDYAEKAFNENEVPIGAVIVKDNKLISFGYNQKEQSNCVLNHAELIAIKEAERKLNNWRLDDCDIYVTLDPCPMCASAIKQARIKNIYSALNNMDIDNLPLISKILSADKCNSSVNLITNLETDRSKKLLNNFFKKQRNK